MADENRESSVPLLGLRRVGSSTVIALTENDILGRTPTEAQRAAAAAAASGSKKVLEKKGSKNHVDLGLTNDNAPYVSRKVCVVELVTRETLVLRIPDSFRQHKARYPLLVIYHSRSEDKYTKVLPSNKSIVLLEGDELCFKDKSTVHRFLVVATGEIDEASDAMESSSDESTSDYSNASTSDSSESWHSHETPKPAKRKRPRPFSSIPIIKKGRYPSPEKLKQMTLFQSSAFQKLDHPARHSNENQNTCARIERSHSHDSKDASTKQSGSCLKQMTLFQSASFTQTLTPTKSATKDTGEATVVTPSPKKRNLGSEMKEADDETESTSEANRPQDAAKLPAKQTGAELPPKGFFFQNGDEPVRAPWLKKDRTFPKLKQPPPSDAQVAEWERQEQKPWRAPSLEECRELQQHLYGHHSDSESDDEVDSSQSSMECSPSQSQAKKATASGSSRNSKHDRPRFMHTSLANTYWKALNSTTPHIGAGHLRMLLETRQLPPETLRRDLVKLVTFGCYTGYTGSGRPQVEERTSKNRPKPPPIEPTPYFDGNRLDLALEYIEDVCSRYPAYGYDLFAEAAGPDYWKNAMDQLLNLTYLDEEKSLMSIGLSLQMHTYTVHLLHRLVNGVIHRPCRESPIVRDMDKYGKFGASKVAARVLAHLWVTLGHHYVKGTEFGYLVNEICETMGEITMLVMNKFVPREKDQVDILIDAFDAQLQASSSSPTNSQAESESAKIREERLLGVKIFWVESLGDIPASLEEALTERLGIVEEFNAIGPVDDE